MIKVRFLKLILSYAVCCMMFCAHDSAAMRAEIPSYNHDDATVKKVTAYVRECINPHMEKVGKAQLNREQQAYLYKSVEGVTFRDIGGTPRYEKKRQKFESGKVGLRNAWCTSYGITAWPTTSAGRNYDAHHIIPLQFNGENIWWNLVPLTETAHDEADSGSRILVGGGLASNLLAAFKSIVVER